MSWRTPTLPRHSTVSQEGNTLLLNFHGHCLLCLQHEDPVILHQIANGNPKGLRDFQSVLCYLTGDPIELGKTTQQKFYPVTKNLPPLCKTCYDILAELYLFHCELMELQRKIQNQTEAGRRIVSGTTRKRGGMRGEFFNRLKIGGIPEEDVGAMKSFIGNFHDLILEADQKPVFPPVTFDDSIRSSSSSSPYQSPSTIMQPYHVEFVKPVAPSSNSASSAISTPFNAISSSALPLQIDQHEEIDEVINEEIDLISPSSSSSNNHVILVNNELNDGVSYEYEGDDELVKQYERLDEKEDDDVVILEGEGKPDKGPVEVIDVSDEEDYGSDHSNELEEGEDEYYEQSDLEYFQSRLSSSLIIEQVDDEENEEQRAEEYVELIEADDNAVMGQGQRRCSSTPVLLLQQPIILSGMNQTPPPSTSATTSSEGLKCRYCDKMYTNARRLNYHEQEHLPGGRPKPFLCGQCNKRFSTNKLLQQHQRIHTGERPCVCDICGARFRQGSTLYRHKRAHKMEQQQQRRSSRLRNTTPSSFLS